MALNRLAKMQIEQMIGMFKLFLGQLCGLREKAKEVKRSADYLEGVQDCIDIVAEKIKAGESITDEEVDQHYRLQKQGADMMGPIRNCGPKN